MIALIAATPGHADTLITNIQGISPVGSKMSTFTSLRIGRDGRILPARSTPQPDDRIVDGRGAYVLPGLIDAHGHVLHYAQTQSRLDLRNSLSLADVLERVALHAAERSGKDVILGHGWNQESWSVPTFPVKHDLDSVVADKPVVLERVDGHALWLNSQALVRAGIDASTPDPPGGRVVRDADGEPTGILVDTAMQLATFDDETPTRKRRRKADPERMALLQASLQELAGYGLTGVHDAGIDADTAKAYRALHKAKRLPIRVYAMLDGTETLKRFGRAYRPRDQMLTIRAVKLIADGALGSRGADLLEPYFDAPGEHGLTLMDDRALDRAIRSARRRGFQVAVHAIGDGANRRVLDAFERAAVDASERHRVEHAQVLASVDFARFRPLGLIASIQAIHATSDREMAERRLGPDRLDGAYAWQRFFRSGVVVANGSDFPVEPANPFLGLYASVTRQDLDGEPKFGWRAEERMSRVEAFRTFTRHAAYAAFMDKAVGTLAPGYWADFILVDRDYFATDLRRIADTKVLQTWVAGRRVWPPEQGDPQ